MTGEELKRMQRKNENCDHFEDTVEGMAFNEENNDSKKGTSGFVNEKPLKKKRINNGLIAHKNIEISPYFPLEMISRISPPYVATFFSPKPVTLRSSSFVLGFFRTRSSI